MNRKLLPLVCILPLVAGCSAQQADKAATYQQQIASACATAMMLAPLAPTIAPWIVGGCESEEAIAKLALDSNSLNWLHDLIAKARAGA